MATRVTAALTALRGQGATVEAIAARDREITDLRAQVTARDQQIALLQAENAQFRSDHAAINASLEAMSGRQATVVDTVAGLGFPAANLPATGSLEQAQDSSPKGIYDEWKRLKSEGKPGEASAYRQKHEAQLRAYSATVKD